MAAESHIVKGGCFCGKIKFQFIPSDYSVANCHCQMCRKTSGAPFVTWVVVPKNDFNYTKGKPTVLQSSKKGQRDFCSQCGTPMVFLTTGSLDNPNYFLPTMAVHTESKLKWLPHTDNYKTVSSV